MAARDRISIVTTSFNQAEFLERTILSVLEQDYCDIEYIVVDPGSNDGSREIIEGHRTRISKLILRPDQGAAEGLNNGFAEATGDVFGFLNSDDVLLPGALSSVMQCFRRDAHIDVFSGHSNLIDANDRFLRRLYSDRMSIQRYLYGATVLIQPSTFFRRRIFDRAGGFNIENKAIWDGELFLDMACAGGSFAVVNRFWSGYRLHANSITGSKKLEERMHKARSRMFSRVQGRDIRQYDRLLGSALRLYRHLSNPLDSMERILRGPVFGRPLDK